MTAGSVFTRLLQVVLGPIVAYALVVTVVRALPAPEAQRDAIALMERPIPPVRGRDATDALWLLTHDVPLADQARAGAALRAYYSATPGNRQDDKTRDRLLAGFPRFVSQRNIGFCVAGELGCLDIVRGHLALAREGLDARRTELAAIRALRDHDGVRFGVAEARLWDTMQPWRGKALALTAVAEAFVSGHEAEGLGEACTEIAAWRRLGADNDSLHSSLDAGFRVRNMALLLGEMIAELPADVALPATCTEALAPPSPAEFDMCPAARLEFRFSRTQTLYDGATPWRRFASVAFLDTRDLAGRRAMQFARLCGDGAIRAMLADIPGRRWTHGAATCNALDSILDPNGCLFIEMIDGFLDGYVDRRTNQAAILGMVRTLDWLRRQPASGAGPAGVLQRLPPSLDPPRLPDVSSDGRSLSIALFDRRPGDRFVLPVPVAYRTTE